MLVSTVERDLFREYFQVEELTSYQQFVSKFKHSATIRIWKCIGSTTKRADIYTEKKYNQVKKVFYVESKK